MPNEGLDRCEDYYSWKELSEGDGAPPLDTS